MNPFEFGFTPDDRRLLYEIARKQGIETEGIALMLRMETQMSKELDDLTAEVAADTAVESSAVTLINGLAAQITAAGTDPAKLSALTSSLTTSSTALAAAVAQNTPVAPAA
jgi:hypothetical protein